MWNMTQKRAAYDNEKQPEHGIRCKMWSMIYLLSSAALTTRRTGRGPLARVTMTPSILQTIPLPRTRPGLKHRGDKVIGNRESKEILRERERVLLQLYQISAESYKWWRILLTTDNFLISLKKFLLKIFSKLIMAELSEQPSNFLYNLSSTFMTFQYILDNYLAWIKMRKMWKFMLPRTPSL